MKKNNGKKLMIAGTVAGILAGYLTGLLAAPKSGKETRKEITDNAIRARRETENKLKNSYKQLTNLQDELSIKLVKVRGKTKKEITSLYKKTEKNRKKIKELLSAIRDGEAEEKDIILVIRKTDDLIIEHDNKNNKSPKK